jgi:hypothetical protein
MLKHYLFNAACQFIFSVKNRIVAMVWRKMCVSAGICTPTTVEISPTQHPVFMDSSCHMGHCALVIDSFKIDPESLQIFAKRFRHCLRAKTVPPKNRIELMPMVGT